jgi:hypothetical protein
MNINKGKNRLKEFRRYRKKYTASSEKKTDCICPICGKEHRTKIYWTGRGTPRINCLACKSRKDLSLELIYNPMTTKGI